MQKSQKILWTLANLLGSKYNVISFVNDWFWRRPLLGKWIPSFVRWIVKDPIANMKRYDEKGHFVRLKMERRKVAHLTIYLDGKGITFI